MRLASFLIPLLWASYSLAAEPPAKPAASEAPADAALEERRGQAKARYEQGVQAYSAGRFKDAVDLFRDADRLAPSAPLSFNIARAYEKLGDDAGALRWYRDYLRRAPDASNSKDVQALVKRYETRLAAKGVQQLTVMSEPSGATVSVDDRPVGVTPWTGELPPGSHRVDVTKRGFEDAALDVRLAADRAQDFSIRLLPAKNAPATAEPAPAGEPPARPEPAIPGPAPAPGAPAETASGGFGIWPWVTLGAGAATLGGALAFEMSRRSVESDAENDPTQLGYQEKMEQMESRQTTARILAGVGGALLVTGGVLLSIDLLSGDDKETGLGVVPGPGGFLAYAGGRY